ncbi:hypothetical protein HZB07_07055 [Candidatus Saganbacteria bacterium]|nr:hypothetical protein [Candidatus Saganbacteria bacterium]
MPIFQAIVLGIIQGIAEFLPISSSAHLIFVPWILNWPEHSIAFDVALHVGTLVAILLFFWREWWGIIKSRLIWLLILGSFPGAFAGFLGEKFFEETFHGPVTIAVFMIGLALLLWLAEIYGQKKRDLDNLSWFDSIIIGTSQALALMPGVSRAGITMTTGLFMGFTREAAAKFSFLLSTPIIAGAGLYKGYGLVKHGLPVDERLPFLVGFLAAALTGIFAIKYLLQYLKNHTFYIFIWYRFAVGIILIILFFIRLPVSPGPIAPALNHEPRVGSQRGVYVTYWVAQTKKRFGSLREQAKAANFNTIVVDAKDKLSPSLTELAKNHQLKFETKLEPDPWLMGLTNELHGQGFSVTARIVVFKDDHLVIARPDLGIHLPNGKIYLDRKGGRWADAYQPEVRLYNQLIAERAALSGVDEVQFDYIRFPTEGAAKTAEYPLAEKSKMTKVETINTYLREARERLRKYGVSIAVDIFGVVAWQSRKDSANLGQDIRQMAQYIDVISPMLYPSHFHNGYDGYSNPGAEPYYFIHSGIERTRALLSNEAVAIVPWLQGFNMRSPNFGPDYILAQVKACKDVKVGRYLFWNAGNNYDTTFAALKHPPHPSIVEER